MKSQTKQESLKVLRLTASNVKRLRAVEIEPAADGLIIITGKNGQGKTSALDAMWLALGGGQAAKSVDHVIRAGESDAFAEVDLGPIIIRRRWRRTDDDKVVSTIEVRTAEGQKYDKPQGTLDALFELVALDPAAFMGMTQAEQVAELIRACGGDEEAARLNNERRKLYDQRTNVNRDLEKTAAELSALPTAGKDVPDSEIPISEVLELGEAARRHDDQNRAARQKFVNIEGDLGQALAMLRMCEQAALDAQAEVKRFVAQVAEQKAIVDGLTEPPNLDEIKTRGAEIEAINDKVRQKKQRAALTQRAAQLKAESASMTTAINAVDQAKKDIIAKANLPVEGLTFADDGVLHNGIPFSDCAESLKLQISVGIAMALNPTLRVIRITNGCALDADNMRLLAEIAHARGYQIWIERVEDSSDGALVIEDGALVK